MNTNTPNPSPSHDSENHDENVEKLDLNDLVKRKNWDELVETGRNIFQTLNYSHRVLLLVLIVMGGGNMGIAWAKAEFRVHVLFTVTIAAFGAFFIKTRDDH
jgi:hypothetical protein